MMKRKDDELHNMNILAGLSLWLTMKKAWRNAQEKGETGSFSVFMASLFVI